MGSRTRERGFQLRSGISNKHRALQHRHLPNEGAEQPSAGPDVKPPKWLGYSSSVGASAPVSQPQAAAGGHVSYGLVPTIAESLRESLAILEQRAIEHELNERLEYMDVLLREQAHRFANSLQIIASTLLTKSRSVRTEEARYELQNAHHRIMSLAAMQQSLQPSADGDRIDLQSCLSSLCETLADSMVADERPVALRAQVDGGPLPAELAVSICRIATELVINALKHAFPGNQTGCAVTIAFEQAGPNWRLTVSDNGTGKGKSDPDKPAPGFGTKIVDALAKHVDAIVEIQRGPGGRTVTVTHGTVAARANSAQVRA